MKILEIGDLTADLFASLKGEVLIAGPSGDAISCELFELRRRVGATREAFTILLRSDEKRDLERGLQTIRHESFETRDLFLTRVAPPPGAPDGAYYEGVFS